MTTLIEKISVNETIEEFQEYIDKIIFLDYDIEQNDIYDVLIYDDFVVTDICRNLIDKEYILDLLNEVETIGKVATINGHYVGLVLYKQEEDYLYLSLIGTVKNFRTKGIPLGKILIRLLEQYATTETINIIKGDSIPEALDFYKKNDWEILSEDKEINTFLIQKTINKKLIKKKNWILYWIDYLFGYI